MLVANHLSWFDIVVLGGATGCAFVAKHELGHPFIHWLADQNHTVYVKRTHVKGAKDQALAIAAALERDQPVALFAEGTTGPGTHLLPFRSTLLEAANYASKDVVIRPVALDYGAAATEVSWFDEKAMDNVWRLLGRRGTLPVTVHLLAPLDRAGDRKQLAQAARRVNCRNARLNVARALAYRRRRMTPKTFKIKSFGCQMNVYDGERMADLLGEQGMSAAVEGEDAELVVLNTCHIREKAAEKAYSDVGRLRREDGSKPLIALAGCVAQAEGAEAKRRSPMIDIVVGPQAYHRLPEMVAEAAHGGRPIDTDMPAIGKFDALPARRRANPSAFLTVQEGCDKFCTYCVVPYTRGAEISRPWNDIVAEARELVDAGAREIVLLGQNVNAWADGRADSPTSSVLWRNRWSRSDPLHDQPPGRHDR